MTTFSRRTFIRNTMVAGTGLCCVNSLGSLASGAGLNEPASQVAITTGANRADMAFRALQPFSAEIGRAIGKRRVILKPNNVMIDRPLTSTHADTLEGILEFLRSIGKLQNVVIAESAANGPTLDGFDNYGYFRLMQKYPVKLADLDSLPFKMLYVFDEKDIRPHAVRVSEMILDPDSYIVSVARMKTHDRVIATLSLKNIVFGAPIKDKGFTWGAARKPGTVNDKPIAHGGGYRGTHYNLFALAGQLHPHLAVIDGFEGMEGNGPSNGTPVDHRVCVASTDWLAADRIAVELMGIDFRKMGYLTYCAAAGMGTVDLAAIRMVGEPLAPHVRSYKLHDNIEKQLVWMEPVH